MKFECFRCHKRLANEDILISHFKIDHFLKSKNLKIECKQNTCSMSFNNFNIFKRHLQCSHKADSDLELSNPPTLEESRVEIFSVLPFFWELSWASICTKNWSQKTGSYVFFKFIWPKLFTAKTSTRVSRIYYSAFVIDSHSRWRSVLGQSIGIDENITFQLKFSI